jgi:hypothetical protein
MRQCPSWRGRPESRTASGRPRRRSVPPSGDRLLVGEAILGRWHHARRRPGRLPSRFREPGPCEDRRSRLLYNTASQRVLEKCGFEPFWIGNPSGFDLRWFTPKVEVALCGHATLASAHVLWNEGYVPSTEAIRFHTKSGLLQARRKEPLIELDFPSTPPSECSPPQGLLEALER